MITVEMLDRVLAEVRGGPGTDPLSVAIKGSRDFDIFAMSALDGAGICRAAGISALGVMRGILSAAMYIGYRLGRAEAEAEALERLVK